jgi:hypothetical protein
VTSADQYSGYETVVAADGTTYERWSEGEDTTITPDQQWDRYEVPEAVEGAPDDVVEMITELAAMEAAPSFGGEGADDVDQAYADEMAVHLAVLLYLGGGGLSGGAGIGSFGPGIGGDGGPGGDPTAFLDAIEEHGEPTMDGDAVVATLRSPDEVDEAFGRPLPDGELSLTFDGDDRPDRLVLRVAAERSSSELELSFTDWDSGLTVAVPGEEEIDPTPWVEEELIRALDLAPVAPGAVPAGWAPTATVIPASDWYDAPEDCEVLDLSYDEPLPADAFDEPPDEEGLFDTETGYVWLYQTSLDCALAVDDAPFEPGGPAGLPHRSSDAAGAEQLLVGETVVEVETSLVGAERDALVASLAPIDIEALVAAVAAEPPDWTL